MNISDYFHTLEGYLSIIYMIQDLIGLSKYIIKCVYGLFLNDKFNNLIAKPCIVAKKSMSFGHCVNVLVKEDYAWIT